MHVVSRKPIQKGGESHEFRSADILLDENGHFFIKSKTNDKATLSFVVLIRQAVRFDAKIMAQSARPLYPAES